MTIEAKVKERNRMMAMNQNSNGNYPGFAQDSTRSFQVLTNQTMFAADTVTQFVKVIRAAFYTSENGKTEPLQLTSRLFVPVQLTNRKSESTSQTVQRINAWIRASGASVIGIDSLQFEYHPESSRMKMNDISFLVNQNQGHYWMTAIRLYINGNYIEPPKELLPPVPVKGGERNKNSECCTII